MRHLLERFFDVKRHQSSLRTECMAGLTTFSTMAYIVVVNPIVLATAGMDETAVMVATILGAVVSTLFMGLGANYPFAVAPGMGMNAYFTYTLVVGLHVPWQTALGACFLAGCLFLLLTVTGVRQLIVVALPESLRVALSGGIGFFLAFIGLKNVNAIVPHPSTFVALGDVTQPEVLLTGFGVALTAALMAAGITGALLITLIVLWLLGLSFGLAHWEGLVAWPPSISPTWLQLDVMGALQPKYWGITLVFLLIAIFDATGALTALGHQGRFLTRSGEMPRIQRAFYADSFGTMVGALLGTSTMSTYLESGAGVASGGRTGLTAVVVGLLFLVALFFSPLVSSIPQFATAPALIVVGALMMRSLSHLAWEDPSEFIPSFIVLVSIPLTFSIATGIALGLLFHPVVKLLCGRYREVHWLAWLLGALSVLKFAT
jgi:AGZA family xanthine/uracil permease-like MFS transporter